MKYLLFIIILFSITIQAQDIPSGYTTNLKLRLYDLDDYPGSDSLNANAQLIDAGYKRNLDTINAIKTDVYTLMNYSGVLKAGKVTNASLSTEVDTSRLKTTGNDAVYGSKYFYNTMYLKTVYPTADDIYNLGSNTMRWQHIAAKRFYGEQFILVNPSTLTDTSIIQYTGGIISFNKPTQIDSFTISKSFTMDSAAALQSLKLKNNAYTISDVGDTIITSSTLMSNIQLTLPGDVTKGIEKINMSGAAAGHILIIYTTDIDDSVLFRDAATDGNLKMAGNLWLRTGDNIAFMYIYDQPAAGWFWMEIWRKNN